MRYWGLPAVVLAASLICLSARCEDYDIMALRGDSGDGAVRVNSFFPAWRAGPPDGGDLTERRNPAFGANPENLVRPRPSRRTAGNNAGYLEWKNSCVRVTPLADGEPPELHPVSDFSQVAPYLARQGASGEGFLELLLRELRTFP